MTKLVFQGDIGLRRIKTLPAGLVPVPRENGRLVLARGEATGHAHVITEDAVELLTDPNGQLYVSADGALSLRHEEHGVVEVTSGLYAVVTQREYTPQGIRNVLD